MGKVILSGYMQVPSEDIAAVLEELPIHKSLTQEELGCLVFSVEQIANSGRFDVYEEFVNQQAFEAHQKRIEGTRWQDVTANSERVYSVKTV